MGARRIWLTAGSGGVGTGFCTVNLAIALSRLGQRVLVVDGGVVCRSLDGILACAEQVVYDLGDVCAGRIAPHAALLAPPLLEGISLLPGVAEPAAAPGAAALHRALDAFGNDFDLILVDAPALPATLPGAGAYALCCVVAAPSAAALRGAEAVGVALRAAGAREVRLLLNRFSLLHPSETGQATALSMVDAVHIPLLGLVPPVGEDEFLPPPHSMAEYPRLWEKKPHGRDRARLAFLNQAKRLLGEEVPLLAGMRGLRFYRRKLLY